MFRVRLAPNSKAPLPENGQRVISNDPAIHEEWRRMRCNLGLLMAENRLVVVDFDEMEPARRFYKDHPSLCTHIVKTPKGIHFRFVGETSTRKFEHGDIKGNGYVVDVGSRVRGKVYALLREGPLQPFPDHLFPRKEVKCSPSAVQVQLTAEIKNIRAYIRGIKSIQGQRGSDACFRVACILRDEGFSEMDALAEMIEWSNECAEPAWSVKELTHKIRGAYRKVQA